MSRREEALKVLIDRMDNAAEDRDKIAAADKILRSDNIAKEVQERAIAVLEAIMNDWTAEDRDKINAADKLKDRPTPRAATALDKVRLIAAMTNQELRDIWDRSLLS